MGDSPHGMGVARLSDLPGRMVSSAPDAWTGPRCNLPLESSLYLTRFPFPGNGIPDARDNSAKTARSLSVGEAACWWMADAACARAALVVLLRLGGAVFQGVFRNPLAEPYLLGSAGGAALGATVALLVPLGLPQSLLLPTLAFAGAWGATVLVIGVSRVAGAVDAAGMLLAGVAIAAVLGALRSFVMLALSDESVGLQIVSWVLGGASDRSEASVELGRAGAPRQRLVNVD
jgi:hypothetical protein